MRNSTRFTCSPEIHLWCQCCHWNDADVPLPSLGTMEVNVKIHYWNRTDMTYMLQYNTLLEQDWHDLYSTIQYAIGTGLTWPICYNTIQSFVESELYSIQERCGNETLVEMCFNVIARNQQRDESVQLLYRQTVSVSWLDAVLLNYWTKLQLHQHLDTSAPKTFGCEVTFEETNVSCITISIVQTIRQYSICQACIPLFCSGHLELSAQNSYWQRLTRNI